MAPEENRAFRERFDLLRGAEQHKNALIEDLLRQMDELTEDYHQERLDHERELHYNRDTQQRERILQDELRKYKNLVDRDAFILVLIDGDGMIFNDTLLSKGEAGGKEAARLLWNSVAEYVNQNLDSIPSNYKIVTRIYANLKGLGDVCQKSGLIEKSEAIEDFARGFTGSKQLFDFVDVGMGKDRADDKISEIFKLHLYDCHCRQILFGCSHDNGYARLLEDVADSSVLNSITLLEGVPFERELHQLKSKYQTTRFEGLFRTSKINIYQQPHNETAARNRMSGLPPPPLGFQSQQSSGLLPSPAQHQPTTTSRQSPASPANGNTTNIPSSTWATAAMSAPPYAASPPPTPQLTAQANQGVERNRWGQRVDPVVKYDASEVKRIKQHKMCNVHYLRGDCPYDPCTHDHYYKINKNELAMLRYISRAIPCKWESGCDDAKCIYGHICPHSTDGKKECYWGEKCRFDRELHGIDRTVVKLTKVGAK